jgi:hypothetical protein
LDVPPSSGAAAAAPLEVGQISSQEFYATLMSTSGAGRAYMSSMFSIAKSTNALTSALHRRDWASTKGAIAQFFDTYTAIHENMTTVVGNHYAGIAKTALTTAMEQDIAILKADTLQERRELRADFDRHTDLKSHFYVTMVHDRSSDSLELKRLFIGQNRFNTTDNLSIRDSLVRWGHNVTSYVPFIDAEKNTLYDKMFESMRGEVFTQVVSSEGSAAFPELSKLFKAAAAYSEASHRGMTDRRVRYTGDQ